MRTKPVLIRRTDRPEPGRCAGCGRRRNLLHGVCIGCPTPPRVPPGDQMPLDLGTGLRP